MTTLFFILAILATVYFLSHFAGAAYIRYKNPGRTVSVSIGLPVYAAVVLLWFITWMSHSMQ